MPNARVPADGEALPSAQGHKSRRAALRLFAAAPALAILPAAAMAAAGDPDPIFAAIERHREAWRTFDAACPLTDNVVAKQEGREVTKADEAVYEAANQAEKDALADLLSLPPVTVAGMRAAIEYFVQWDDGCIPEDSGEFLSTLLKSPLLAVKESEAANV